MTPAATAEIEIRPLSGDDLPRLWEMMLEFPENNFDDSAPRSLDAFEQLMADRVHYELLFGFHAGGELVGAMAYHCLTARTGMLRGVCFARAVHGTGIPFAAVRSAISGLHADGAEKISAQMFADNQRAWRFFQKLGAVEEGLLRAHTTRAGVPIDVRVIAFFRGAD